MTRRSRVLPAVLAIGALTIAACGGGDDSAEGGGTTLTFLSWDNEEIMTPVFEAFEEAHPDITIEASYAPPVAEYIQALQTRVLSGTAPDVFIIAAENKTNLIEGGHVLDLAGEDFVANTPEFNQETYGADGAVYGLSVSTWGSGITYNKDLLAQIGMDTPPQDWEEFLQMCADLQDAGITPFLESLQNMPTILTAFLGSYSASMDGRMDEEIFSGAATFEDHWTASLEQYNRMYADGLVSSDTVGLSPDQVRDEFINGRVAMFPAGPWDLPAIREGAPDMEVEMVPVPAVDGGQPFIAGAAGVGYAINSDSDNLDAAKTFLEFLGSPDGMRPWQEGLGAISVTTDYEPVLDEALTPILEDVRAGNVYLPQISWQRAEDVLNVEAVAQLQLMAQGRLTPREVAQALDRKLAAS
ncbi:ABC transporter substrate-binding protein [Jiangella endophytica]|uniref:ABC transporter substrate-binding protein n=1 Tax=Jiangella endophytica TaxID=1623398 RepID=UPI0013008330|nr:extracellular solute-binding protein [Jiangella endophytica]